MPSLASREPPLACGALHYSQNRRPKPSLRPNLSIRDAESTTNTSCRTTKATPTRLGGGFGFLSLLAILPALLMKPEDAEEENGFI